jgi:hypothetical protein
MQKPEGKAEAGWYDHPTDEGYEKVKEVEIVQITGVISEEEAKKISPAGNWYPYDEKTKTLHEQIKTIRLFQLQFLK